jgi:hypothetical protein
MGNRFLNIRREHTRLHWRNGTRHSLRAPEWLWDGPVHVTFIVFLNAYFCSCRCVENVILPRQAIVYSSDQTTLSPSGSLRSCGSSIGMPKKNARTRSGSATLFSVKKEMAKPCVAPSTRQAADTPAGSGRPAAGSTDESTRRAETKRILLDYGRKLGS